MYDYNNAAVIVSALINSGVTQSFISISLLKNFNYLLFWDKNLQYRWLIAQSLPGRSMSMISMGL